MLTARRCAVLGSPIGHSLSPRLHRAAYAALGLDWRYDAYDVDVAALPAFVSGLGPEWAGLSLTMPLKEAALALADEVDPVAARTGAANTLLLDPPRRALNTDVPGLRAVLAAHGFGDGSSSGAAGGDGAGDAVGGGMVAPVPAGVRALVPDGAPATVLGGGATARSALVALAGCVSEVVVLVRDARRVADLAPLGLPYPVLVGELRDDVARAAALARPLVLSTVPSGVLDHLAAEVATAGSQPAAAGTDARAVPGRRVFLDVGYDRWPTPLSTAYAATGRATVSGLDLLVHQAALQVAAMTGLPAPLAAMWAAVRPPV